MTKQEQQQEARDALRAIYPKGSDVYVILRHVSRSGMSRTIGAVGPKMQPTHHLIAQALGWRYDADRAGVRVEGAGMDMGFHLVYSLAQALYGDGYALTARWL